MTYLHTCTHSNFQQKILKTSDEFNLLLLLPSPILKENREILQELILFTNKHFPKNGFNNPERKVSKSMGLLSVSQCIILKSFLITWMDALINMKFVWEALKFTVG